MKGGTPYRLRGKLLFLMLSVLICITIFLLAWEKTPLVTSLLSVQDQFAASYSDILVDSSGSPTQEIRQKGHGGEDLSDEVATRETTNEQGQDLSVQPTGYVTKHLTNSTENIRNLTTSTEKKDILVDSSGSPAQEISQKGHGGEDFLDEVATRETSNEQGQDLSMQPTGSATKNLTKSIESISSLTTSAEEKVCNYAKGKWVADGRRPLYSGFGCKRWLSGMWACRLTQRTDFSYEGFRWQPQNCEMPDFEASAFLRRMKDKTLAFVGDSLGRQQFQSLMCMASGGKDSPEVQDVGWEYGLVKARGAIRPDGWAYRFPTTNTTILYYWSASLCDLEPLNVTDPATYFAMHLDRPAAFLRRYLSRFDVLVLNTGHHWNRGKLNANRWVMHLNGMPIKDKKLAQIGNAKNFAVSSIIKWLNSQLPLHPRLKAFFRTISPRHFSNGDWDSGGRCDNTTPLSRGAEVTKDESSHPVVENAVKGTGVKILDITALSELRDEGHISRYSIKATEGVNDCLHWCLPGIPDTWNELLFAQL